jgi:hypothetical protein
MTDEAFQEIVSQDAHLFAPLRRAAGKLRPQQFHVVAEAAAVALLFPLVQYVLTTIGLPWLGELRRYSELQRQRVHEWIDRNHRQHGLDPDAAEQASDSLLEDLEATTDGLTRRSWENLLQVVKGSGKSA